MFDMKDLKKIGNNIKNKSLDVAMQSIIKTSVYTNNPNLLLTDGAQKVLQNFSEKQVLQVLISTKEQARNSSNQFN